MSTIGSRGTLLSTPALFLAAMICLTLPPPQPPVEKAQLDEELIESVELLLLADPLVWGASLTSREV